ncbi:MAG: T9SS type A sorting domain-containing protein [Bacteroidia bacterium]
MIKKLLIIGVLLNNFTLKGQNMVPNGGFEDTLMCPTSMSQIDYCLFWTNPCLPPYNSGTGGSGSSDYFNACSESTNVDIPFTAWGYQFAHSGNGYAGLYAYTSVDIFREYIEVTLNSPLISNNCYHLEIHVNLANASGLTTDTIGIYFSDSLITGFHTHDTLPFVPQLKLNSGFITDTLNWTLLSGNYFATGGESYMTIGNFNSNANTNLSPGWGIIYFFIDDVSLTDITGINEHNPQTEIIIYPNPAGEELNVQCSMFNVQEKEIKIYDVMGKEVLKSEINFQSSTFNIQSLKSGMYFIEINGVRKKFVKK